MSLFHTPEFCKLKSVPFIVKDGCKLLVGPHAGTYGGFSECASFDVMDEMLSFRLTIPERVVVKLAPASHDLQLFSRSMNALMRAGFMLEYADMNYDMVPRELDFNSRINHGARKKLAKCHRAGYVSAELDRTQWTAAHWLLTKQRTDAGHAPPIPLADIEALEKLLPGTYRFFGTYAPGHIMVAAAICVMVERDIIYVYVWGDVGKTEYAPTVQLCEAIYQEACVAGCRLLDCGTATLNGIPNPGLIKFKESLGFLPSVKATMVRK